MSLLCSDADLAGSPRVMDVSLINRVDYRLISLNGKVNAKA